MLRQAKEARGGLSKEGGGFEGAQVIVIVTPTAQGELSRACGFRAGMGGRQVRARVGIGGSGSGLMGGVAAAEKRLRAARRMFAWARATVLD